MGYTAQLLFSALLCLLIIPSLCEDDPPSTMQEMHDKDPAFRVRWRYPRTAVVGVNSEAFAICDKTTGELEEEIRKLNSSMWLNHDTSYDSVRSTRRFLNHLNEDGHRTMTGRSQLLSLMHIGPVYRILGSVMEGTYPDDSVHKLTHSEWFQETFMNSLNDLKEVEISISPSSFTSKTMKNSQVYSLNDVVNQFHTVYTKHPVSPFGDRIPEDITGSSDLFEFTSVHERLPRKYKFDPVAPKVKYFFKPLGTHRNFDKARREVAAYKIAQLLRFHLQGSHGHHVPVDFPEVVLPFTRFGKVYTDPEDVNEEKVVYGSVQDRFNTDEYEFVTHPYSHLDADSPSHKAINMIRILDYLLCLPERHEMNLMQHSRNPHILLAHDHDLAFLCAESRPIPSIVHKYNVRRHGLVPESMDGPIHLTIGQLPATYDASFFRHLEDLFDRSLWEKHLDGWMSPTELDLLWVRFQIVWEFGYEWRKSIDELSQAHTEL